MNHQELYKLLLTVQKNVRCPQCGKQYDFGKIQIRGVVDMIVFLELACSNHLPLLATVTLGKPASINKEPAAKDAVSSDDVIKIYRTLKEHKGSLSELINKNGSIK